MAEPLAPAASDDHDHQPHGWRRWVYATNHKDIGTMYLVFAGTMFFIGGLMAMLIRLELFKPGLQFFDPQFFNSMTTLHALIMIFGAVMPAWTGLANWMIPMQIGAPDMALPRLNNFSFWILPFAFTLLLSSLFVPGGAPAGGWTMYPPLVLQTGASFPMLIFSIHLMGASSILGAINVIVTIVNMRAPGMTLLRMPLFVWTWLITAYLLIAVMPVLAGAVTMLLTDHFFGTTFFTAAGGGDPVMFQHIFWFFGHPEVYILILPVFGIMAGVYYWLPKWAGRMYDLKLATWHFWLSAIFVNVLFFPQHFLGLAGMPRRIPDYAVQFTDWNMVSSIGALGFGLAQLLFPYIIWKCARSGERIGKKAWEGAHGLEWELPSPPPYHSWTTPPSDAVIARGAAH